MTKRMIDWWWVNDRICQLRIKSWFFKLSLIGSDTDGKDAFYAFLTTSTGSVQSTILT